MPEVAEVLTANEAAELLRVSTRTVLTLAREGKLPGEKVGRAWRFVRADLLDYVRGEKRNPPGVVAS
jgi:excisionase family DNA binding protein